MIKTFRFGALMFFAAIVTISCVATGHGSMETAPPGPERTEWRLAEVNGETVAISGKGQPSLILDTARKMASGFAGCNNFFGSYTLDKNSLKFGPLGSTRRACPENESALEASFLNALERCRRWKIGDGALLLIVDDEVLARFVTAAENEAAPDPGSMTYRLRSVPSGMVTLSEGKYQAPAAPDSTSKILVTLTDRVFGTIREKEVGAAVLAVSLGGTGSFHELALLSRGAKGWESTDSLLLGDRIKVRSMMIENDHIVLAMTVHGPNDTQCCPTLEVTQRLTVKDGLLVAAGKEAAAATVLRTDTTWQWLGTRYSNDTTVAPATPGNYTIRFLENGNLEVMADCNRKGGTYTLDGDTITLLITHSTMAACEQGSLEERFVRDLAEGVRFSMEEGDLFISLKHATGTMKFTGTKER
jgi:heat shock protein HslJ